MLHVLLERNLIPDILVRQGIRRLVRRRLEEERAGGEGAVAARRSALLERLTTGPIAVHTEDANAQHYEVPPEFFSLVLGKHLKYSCGFWAEDRAVMLDQAEEAMLDLTCSRADIQPDQDILELGCGWGSLTLYLAARFPSCRITALSNSHSQRQFIEARASQRGLTNLRVITCDINTFRTEDHFDRIVSVEMFEHMRNYRLLMDRVAGWLRPGGKLFVHVFAHKQLAYLFEVRDKTDWMARHFFTGGLMPSQDLLPQFGGKLTLDRSWCVDGTHYQRTAEAWLTNMDRAKSQIIPIFRGCYGKGQAARWWAYWRTFFMACAELWGHDEGREWVVCHYRFFKPESRATATVSI